MRILTVLICSLCLLAVFPTDSNGGNQAKIAAERLKRSFDPSSSPNAADTAGRANRALSKAPDTTAIPPPPGGWTLPAFSAPPTPTVRATPAILPPGITGRAKDQILGDNRVAKEKAATANTKIEKAIGDQQYIERKNLATEQANKQIALYNINQNLAFQKAQKEALQKLIERRRILADPRRPKVFKEPKNSPSNPDLSEYKNIRQADGRGIFYQKPGALGENDSIRVMLPSEIYPNGHWVMRDNSGNYIDLRSGRPAQSIEDYHIPLMRGYWETLAELHGVQY